MYMCIHLVCFHVCKTLESVICLLFYVHVFWSDHQGDIVGIVGEILLSLPYLSVKDQIDLSIFSFHV